MIFKNIFPGGSGRLLGRTLLPAVLRITETIVRGNISTVSPAAPSSPMHSRVLSTSPNTYFYSVLGTCNCFRLTGLYQARVVKVHVTIASVLHKSVHTECKRLQITMHTVEYSV